MGDGLAFPSSSAKVPGLLPVTVARALGQYW